MTDSERAEAGGMLEQLRSAVGEGEADQAQRGRFGVVAQMLLAYPIANASAETGRARGEAYRDALAGLPPWSVAAAVKRWHRGEAGDDHDYRWAPAPAVLRRLASAELDRYQDAIVDLEHLLTAVPFEEAMGAGATPEQRERVIAGFQKLSADLKASAPPPAAPQPKAPSDDELRARYPQQPAEAAE